MKIGEDKKTGFTYQGKEILLTRQIGKPLQGLAKKGMEKGIYPESKRIQVATLFAVLGNVERVSELSDVPVSTIQSWRKSQWFRDLLVEIREENNDKLDAKFTEVIEASVELLLDRMRNGDYVINSKTGELFRKPVSLRDLSLVGAISIDKRQLMRGLPTSRTEAVTTNADKLDKLADAFMKLAAGRTPEKKNDDKEDQGGIQSSVGEIGQESGVFEDTGGSQEEVSASGILQTQEQVG